MSDIIINNVLCYISSARHSLPEDNIIIVVKSFYSFDKIKEAKDVIHDLCQIKGKRRKADDKISSEIKDILTALKNRDNAITLPRFVVDQHDGLPPNSGFLAVARNMETLMTSNESLMLEIQQLQKTVVMLSKTTNSLNEEVRDSKKSEDYLNARYRR